MATEFSNNQPAWVQTILNSVEGVRDEVSDVKDDVRDLRGDIKEVRLDVSGKDGLRERVATLEALAENYRQSVGTLKTTVEDLAETVSALADREATPVSIVTTKKSSVKEQATMAGLGGSAVLVLNQLLQLASEYIKTK